MDTSTSMILTAILATAGSWAKGKGVSVRMAVAAVFLGIMLSVIGQSEPKFAKQFGILILVSATFAYAPAILGKIQLNKKPAK